MAFDSIHQIPGKGCAIRDENAIDDDHSFFLFPPFPFLLDLPRNLYPRRTGGSRPRNQQSNHQETFCLQSGAPFAEQQLVTVPIPPLHSLTTTVRSSGRR
jgi:hypothetical protein